jgi:creatinine amidohydrolase
MRWDELTPPEFVKARETSGGACILPIACVERHGDHCPLGTDAFASQAICRRAAEKEPVVWFPTLLTGVNGEAFANPGAIALRTETILALLENMCEEIARNGFSKIIIYSTHGGNGHVLSLFVQQAMVKPGGYVPYFYSVGPGYMAARPSAMPGGAAKPRGHAGVYETSVVMAHAPGTVKMDQTLSKEKAEKLRRLDHLTDLGVYTPVSYYANYPYHYAAHPENASSEIGEEVIDACAELLAEVVREIRKDETTPVLWREMLARSEEGGTLEIPG